MQILTEDVPTMLLVHGSGHEIISNFDTVVSEDYDDEVDADKEDGDKGDVRWLGWIEQYEWLSTRLIASFIKE